MSTVLTLEEIQEALREEEELRANEVSDIYVEEDDWLKSPVFKHLLAQRLIGLEFEGKPVSRRTTTDWLADVIFKFCEDGGRIYDGDGDEIIIHDEIIDDAYFDDISFSWNSDVRAFAKRMPQRRSSDRLILRLQLFDAALRITEAPIEYQLKPLFPHGR